MGGKGATNNMLQTTLVTFKGQRLKGILQRRKQTITKGWKKYGMGYLFLSPFVILLMIFTVIPVIIAIYLSFNYYNMLQPPRWLGLTNYRILFMDDDIFLIAIKNTLFFALIAGPVGYIMSFIMAWVLNRIKLTRVRNIFALGFYAPSITSGIAMSVVWLYFFSGDRYGLINHLLIRMGFITEPILWNMDSDTIMPVVIIISIWMSMGTGFLVFLAGLQNIPKELYDAGAVDGIKNHFQELWYITLPMMKPQLLFGAVDSIVKSFGVFDIAVSVAGMPSPNYAAHTIVAHLYDYAFIRFEMGYAAAVAVVLFMLTFLLGRVVMKVFSSKDMY